MNSEKNLETNLGLKNSYSRNLFLFLFGSIAGIIIFFVPINGVLPFETLYKGLIVKPVGDKVIYVILAYVTFMFFGFLYAKFIAKEGSFMAKFFKDVTKFHGIIYFLAFVFTLMYYFQTGIGVLINDKTTGLMINEVMPYTISIIPVGAAVLPLLASFGILEVIGSLLEPLMRPVFKSPGKSALDSIASVVGAAVVGILFTSTLYKDNQYTDREATFISTSFSLNSVGYCAFLAGYVGLLSNFSRLFVCYAIVSYLIAAIITRIPPISKHTNIYYNGTVQTKEMRTENVKFGKEQIKKGFTNAIKKADESDGLVKETIRGLLNGIGLSITVAPMMIAIGAVCLVVYNYTPVVDIISKPLVPIISLLGVSDPVIAAKAIFVGGIDLFLPSVIIGASNVAMATKYFVLVVSLVQVLYITETMLPIIFLGIPVKLKELLLIWLERTLIAMPLVAILMHIFY